MTRVVLLQLGSAGVSGLLFWLGGGAQAALAAMSGGVIAAMGSALFGWRMFSPGIAPAAVLQRAMFAGEALKWLWYVAAIWLCFAKFKMPAAALLTGLIVAQFAYWIGLIGTKRG